LLITLFSNFHLFFQPLKKSIPRTSENNIHHKQRLYMDKSSHRVRHRRKDTSGGCINQLVGVLHCYNVFLLVSIYFLFVLFDSRHWGDILYTTVNSILLCEIVFLGYSGYFTNRTDRKDIQLIYW
jgi:hypothetical protein